MSKKEQPVDRRILRTRQLLRSALIELIREKGFDALTIQDITDRATINRATFYLHYRDKYDLLEQYTKEILDELVIKLSPSKSAPPHVKSDQPSPQLIALFEHVAKHSDFFRVMFKGIPSFYTQVARSLRSVFQEMLEHVRAEGHQLSAPEGIIISFITSGYVGLIVWWLDNDMCYSARFMASQLHNLYNSRPAGKEKG